MCGATGAEKTAQQQEASIAGNLNSNFGNVFGMNSSIGKSLNAAMTPIVNAGLNQQGFSPAVTAAETANIQDTGAANAANTANVVNEKMAQTGEANPAAVAGVDAAVTQRAQQQTAEQQNQFNVENAEKGEQNFFDASQKLPGEEAELEGATTGAGTAAENAENTAMGGAQDIEQANTAWMAPVAGIIGAGVKGATGGL